MNLSLTGEQVAKLAGPGTKVLSYPQLANVQNINQLLPKCMILYQTGDKGGSCYGHWTSIAKIGNGIYFFDSYGTFPDDQQKYIGNGYLEQSGQVRKKLQKLMKFSGYGDLNYNEHRYQQMKEGINTCGRHSGLFLRSGLTSDQYYNMMSKIKKELGGSYDSIIVKLTDGMF